MTKHDAGERDDSTTELDRSALGVAPEALPFPPAPDSRRGSLPSVPDGALPFRSAPTPPSHAASVREALSGAFGQRVAAPALVAPPPPPPPSPRAELGDVFRRAFGLGRGADLGSPSSTPTTTSGIGALPTSTTAPAEAPSTRIVSAKMASDAAVTAEARAGAVDAWIAPPHAIRRRAIVDLLAFDPAVPKRLRRAKEHAALLNLAPPSRTPKDVDAPAGEPSTEERARHDVLRVLSCGAPTPVEALALTLEALLDDPLELELPLALVEGDVSPTMDEYEGLRAAVEHAKPLAGTNKRLLAAVGGATEALARSTLPPPEVATALHAQIDAATSDLGLPPRHLAKLVERTLRDARAYKRVTLLGAPRIRASLAVGSSAVPIYLPATLADVLPLLPTFRVLALVESRPREDAAEASSSALVAHAIGRVLYARGGGRD